MSELETKLVQARTDSKAQVKGHNSGKKELEAHVPPLLSCRFCVAWALQLWVSICCVLSALTLIY